MLDKELSIAIGNSRKQKTWKNKKIKWSELLDQLSNTTRTRETVAEYRRMPKSRQDEIKDVGGFVGGYLVKGRRSNVKYRDIIALDIDFGGTELWDAWELSYGNASCLYSTHKHTPDNPRLRMIIPLNRHVSPDEYQATARMIASELGINAFDDTTFQPQRLMYWPSTSSDGEYIFEKIDGDFLDVDDVLNKYDDWRDITSWSTSDRGSDIVKNAVKKQKDPLEKDGVVGAFCRSYSIEEAIENFVEDYVPCSIPGRYTYAKGSTSAGVIVYDHIFSYSHHGTDPASGILCNAFDLVRLHKFKDLDEDAKENTPPGRMPSFLAMEEFASKDKKVIREIAEARHRVAMEFDDESTALDKEDDGEWKEKFDVSKKGVILSNYHNIELIMENDPIFKNKLGFDDMAKREVFVADMPWKKYNPLKANIEDNDDANIRIYLENCYGITGKDRILDVLSKVSHKNIYHPVKRYLESLEWDGVKRLDTIFVDYFACENTEYVRAVTRKTLLAAVKRVYEPGCHFDNMLVLKGPQGCGKSSFFRKLARGWFTDSIKDIRNKDTLEGLLGVWIAELGELAPMKKADNETIKSFLSGTVDRFRKAYGRRTESYPRQCIFVATTNESEFLRDQTGNRRFWIISASKTRRPAKDVFSITDADIDQLWAEAKALYDAGTETVYLDRRLEEEASVVQEQYMMEDPKVEVIREFLERKLPEDWDTMDLYDRQSWLASDKVGTIIRDRVCAAEVWCEAMGHDDTKNLTQYETSEINRIIDMLPGWEKQKSPVRFKIYGHKRGFLRVEMYKK